MITEIVKFHEEELIAGRDNETVWVAINPLSKAIGVNTTAVLRSIKSDEVLSRVCTTQYVHDASGRRQNMMCIPLEYIHGWLFSINVSLVKEEVRPKLVLFKLECYHVLNDHFFGPSRKVTSNVTNIFRLKVYLNKLDKLIARLNKRRREVSMEISAYEINNFQQLRLFDNTPSKTSPEELLK